MMSGKKLVNPKSGVDKPKEPPNFVTTIAVGTKPCLQTVSFLRCNNRFAETGNVTVALLSEKSHENIKRYQWKLHKLGRPWNHGEILFRAIPGAGEEYVKDVKKSLEQFGTWHEVNENFIRKGVAKQNRFGGSVVLYSPVSQGGHFPVWLDQMKCLAEQQSDLEYKFGWAVETTDKQSQRITNGALPILMKYPILDAIIYTSNKKANPARPVELMDTFVNIGASILFNRNSYISSGNSIFDVMNDLCQRTGEGTPFIGVSATAGYNPEILRRRSFLGIKFSFLKKQERHRDYTINSVKNLISSVLYDPKNDLTGLQPIPDSTVYVTVTGLIPKEELVQAIAQWNYKDSGVTVLFLPSSNRDLMKNERIIATAFRKVRPPVFNKEIARLFYKREFGLFLKLSQMTEQQFSEIWKRRSFGPTEDYEQFDLDTADEVIADGNGGLEA